MKRCPQCEFIYEDDQSLCDMDGVLLVYDSRTLPNLHALATVSAPLPGKSQRRSRMMPAFATVVLMIVIGTFYYVSSIRNSAPNAYSPASTTAEAPAVVPSAPAPDSNQAQLPATEPIPETTAQSRDERETRPAPGANRPAAAPTRKTTTKPAATKPEPKKDDSKVESILKKTGKILKKPFKF